MSSEVSSKVIININRVDAWCKLRDLSKAHHYVPGLVKTEFNTAIKEGIGASRRVFQSESKGIDETVTQWEDGSGFLIRLHRGDKGPPPPFKEAYFRYWLEEGAKDGTTQLTTTLTYTMRMGFLGSLLEKLILKKAFHAVIRDVAISLKQFYETGQPVTPKRLKEIKRLIQLEQDVSK
jgi:Polyketide cyclase / dehydrase and lipid transport